VLDNPLTLTDPLGLDCVYLDSTGGTGGSGPGGASIDHDSSLGECNAHGGYWANGYIGSLNDVQTFQNNDNVLILSQNGADPEITVASQNESQGVSLFGNVPPSFFSGQFADPSYFDQSVDDWTVAAMTLNLAGMESTRYLSCAGKAAVANTIPFGGHLVGMGSAKSDAQDVAKDAATHPFTTSKVLNKIDLPNIGEAFVSAYKNPLVRNGAKVLEKADPYIAAYGFSQDFSECASKP
jgi:hypothetical protein